MIDKIAEILVGSNEGRRNKIIEILEKNNITYDLHTEKENSAINIIVRLNQSNDKEEKVVVLGAHYDVVPGSLGINDNGCAVVMLLEFIKRNKNKELKVPLEIVFFDQEESGMIGSSNYVNRYKDRIDYAIIFDIIAFGDRLLFGSYDSRLSEIFKDIEISKLDTVLPSDNMNFDIAILENALVTAALNTDLIKNKDGSYKLKPYPEFYSSFHNRKNDNNMDVINLELINKAINILDSLFIA